MHPCQIRVKILRVYSVQNQFLVVISHPVGHMSEEMNSFSVTSSD